MTFFDIEALQAMAQKTPTVRVFSDDLLELIYTLKSYEHVLKRISEEPGISGEFATLALKKAGRKGIHEPESFEIQKASSKHQTYL